MWGVYFLYYVCNARSAKGLFVKLGSIYKKKGMRVLTSVRRKEALAPSSTDLLCMVLSIIEGGIAGYRRADSVGADFEVGVASEYCKFSRCIVYGRC